MTEASSPGPTPWPDRSLIDLLRIDLPIIQAPMAGASGPAMAAAVSAAGGLGSLPCAMLDAAGVRNDVAAVRALTAKPLNLNFFCHQPPAADEARERAWRDRLRAYYAELDVEAPNASAAPLRAPFDDTLCEVVEELRPQVVSFHFGLPAPALVRRVKAAGCVVLSSATTVAEARWLEDHGCDAVIAQGCEAGGHRGMFLDSDVAAQPGTLALVPQVVDAVNVPVIAAGGIGDGRGIAAAFALGAAGVQIGTAFLLTPESLVSPLHREALRRAGDGGTALTNLFTGRPARSVTNRLMREVGPLSPDAPAFPTAGGALSPLRKAAEAQGSDDFSPLWSGQSARFCREIGARELMLSLAEDARSRLQRLADKGGQAG